MPITLSLALLLALGVVLVGMALCGVAGGGITTPALPGAARWADRVTGGAPDARAARRGRVAGWLCGVGLALDLLFLLGGAQAAALPLPLGLPGYGATLVLDAPAGLMLLPVLLLGAACCLAVPQHAAPLPVAAASLLVLAGDAYALACGGALVTLALRELLLAAPRAPVGRQRAGLLWLVAGATGTLCLLGAQVLLLPQDGLLPGLDFPVLRGVAPAGLRGGAVLALSLLATAAFGGLPPFGSWLGAACRQLPTAQGALASGLAGVLGPYLALRLVVDLGGSAAPGWWGVPMLALGAVVMVSGARQALAAGELRGVGAGAAVSRGGLAVLAIGLALLARGADLPVLAALALAGALFTVLAGAPVQALLLLAAGAVEAGAGTRRLDRLGGLMHRMRWTAAALGLACASLAALPPGAGFAAIWLVLQALLAATRIGGQGLQLMLVAALAAAGLGSGLLALAGLRVVAAALLGRPRSPRGAAADEAPASLARVLAGLAVVSGMLGVLPGAVLALADPALRQLVGAGLEGRSGVWLLAPQRDAPGYAALPVALLLAALAALGVLLARTRRAGLGQEQRVPAWEDGFAPPPPWLPFGDPLTQVGAATLAEVPLQALGVPAGPWWRFPTAVRSQFVVRFPAMARRCGRGLARLADRARTPGTLAGLRLLLVGLLVLLVVVALGAGSRP